MNKTKWIKTNDYMTRAVAEYRGVKIERTSTPFYYFHVNENDEACDLDSETENVRELKETENE